MYVFRSISFTLDTSWHDPLIDLMYLGALASDIYCAEVWRIVPLLRLVLLNLTSLDFQFENRALAGKIRTLDDRDHRVQVKYSASI